jgi:hypothetical protein
MRAESGFCSYGVDCLVLVVGRNIGRNDKLGETRMPNAVNCRWHLKGSYEVAMGSVLYRRCRVLGETTG